MAILTLPSVVKDDFSLSGLCEGCEYQLITIEQAKKVQQYVRRVSYSDSCGVRFFLNITFFC